MALRFNSDVFKNLEKTEKIELERLARQGISKDAFSIETKYLNSLNANKQASLKIDELAKTLTKLINNCKGQ